MKLSRNLRERARVARHRAAKDGGRSARAESAGAGAARDVVRDDVRPAVEVGVLPAEGDVGEDVHEDDAGELDLELRQRQDLGARLANVRVGVHGRRALAEEPHGRLAAIRFGVAARTSASCAGSRQV